MTKPTIIHTNGIKGLQPVLTVEKTNFSEKEWGVEVILSEKKLYIPWHSVLFIELMSA